MAVFVVAVVGAAVVVVAVVFVFVVVLVADRWVFGYHHLAS